MTDPDIPLGALSYTELEVLKKTRWGTPVDGPFYIIKKNGQFYEQHSERPYIYKIQCPMFNSNNSFYFRNYFLVLGAHLRIKSQK